MKENRMTEVKPTLTEDERVLLRNIDKYTIIARDENGEIAVGKLDFANCIDWKYLEVFNHLFQFIKNGEEYSIEELLSDD